MGGGSGDGKNGRRKEEKRTVVASGARLSIAIKVVAAVAFTNQSSIYNGQDGAGSTSARVFIDRVAGTSETSSIRLKNESFSTAAGSTDIVKESFKSSSLASTLLIQRSRNRILLGFVVTRTERFDA